MDVSHSPFSSSTTFGTTEAEIVALLAPPDLLDGSHWLYTCHLEAPHLELDLEVVEGRLAAFERRRLDSLPRYPESLTETTFRLLGDLTVPERSHEAARTLLSGSRELELAAPALVPVVRDGWVKDLGGPDAELRCVAAQGLGALVAGAPRRELAVRPPEPRSDRRPLRQRSRLGSRAATTRQPAAKWVRARPDLPGALVPQDQHHIDVTEALNQILEPR